MCYIIVRAKKDSPSAGVRRMRFPFSFSYFCEGWDTGGKDPSQPALLWIASAYFPEQWWYLGNISLWPQCFSFLIAYTIFANHLSSSLAPCRLLPSAPTFESGGSLLLQDSLFPSPAGFWKEMTRIYCSSVWTYRRVTASGLCAGHINISGNSES